MNFNKSVFKAIACLSVSFAISHVALAEQSGPIEDLTYVRFVNATDTHVSVTSAQGAAKIDLSAQGAGRVSNYFAVKAGTQLPATIQNKDKKQTVHLVGNPWEYITIILLPDSATELKTVFIRETPEDFTGKHPSLGIFNIDPKCEKIKVSQNESNELEVKLLAVERLYADTLNPIVSASCYDKAKRLIDLSGVENGKRYSAFVLGGYAVENAIVVEDNL